MPRAVLITGAAGALGASVVRRFLAGGDRVVAVDRDPAALERLRSDVGSGELVSQSRDLTDSEAVAAAFAEAALGSRPVVVHLVGGFRFGALAETSDEDWGFLMRVNLDTTFRVLRQCARLFTASGGGSVVAVSSPAASVAGSGMGPYGAAKAGVLRLVEALARELASAGSGRANAVVPGTMDTPGNRRDMPNTDPQSWVATDEVAAVIHFLSSDAAAAVNGAAVDVPGPTLGS
jgi:NAD(P)-dependent dehydrogenase (short-subunit alcohol dehydrogenase family)